MKILANNQNYVIVSSGEVPQMGSEFRISFTGNHGWRIQTRDFATGCYNDKGASQRLSYTLKEEPYAVLETIGYEKKGCNAILSAPDGSKAKINLTTGEINFVTASGKVAQTITAVTASAEGSTVTGKLLKGEAVYGTGERYDKVNQRGQKLDLFTYDIWDEINACYVVIPLLCFTRGSGVFVNRYERMTADLGATDPDLWSVNVIAAPLDCYVFACDKIADAIYGYSAISGFAKKPQEWTYGMLVCRYWPDFGNKAGVMTMIRKMEEYKLPWKGIIMEGWDTYGMKNYDEWKELCDYIHGLGKKVLAYMFVGHFGDGKNVGMPDENYLVHAKTNAGVVTNQLPSVRAGVYNPDFGNGVRGVTYLDITNEAACKWYFGDLWGRISKDIGVDGCKIDFCELYPENETLLYADPNEETAGSHHWYPTAFCAKYLAMENEKPDGGMCLTRGGGIGSQRSPYIWAGDQSRRYDRIGWQLTCMLESGLSGVPFMSYDMSGYQYRTYGGRILYDENDKMYYAKSNGERVEKMEDANIYPEAEEADIFIRGTEYTAFTISMQTHGKVRRCYDFAEEGDTVTTDIYREYVKLHEELTPYITEYVDEACKTGMPVVRHLILKFPNDKKVFDIKDEYMFGDAFLVAPVLDEKSVRNIYLPEGKWTDLITGEHYTVDAKGLTLKKYAATKSQIPVFFNEETDSKTYKQVLGKVKETFKTVKSIKYAFEK